MNLDNLNDYKKLDSDKVAESIEALTEQMKQVLKQAQAINLPAGYGRATQLVVNGMGGSNIGVGLLSAALSDKIKVPVIITPGYQVPASVDKNTLYLFSSYSGNTEEPLSVFDEVKKRGAKILVIAEATDNKLTKLMKEHNLPGFTFSPDNNPCGQPRLGLGYSVLGVAMLLIKAGLVEIKNGELEKLISALELWNRSLGAGEPTKTNRAKEAALKLFGRVPVIVGAEFLAGNLAVLRNQFNETSKNFAAFLILPDLNHYALEGLTNPKSNKDNLIFFFFDSKFYHPRVQKRSKLTKQVVQKNGINYLEHELTGATKLEQAFEMLQFGCWVTYYLAMLNDVNPVKIPWVDWFKEQLGD